MTSMNEAVRVISEVLEGHQEAVSPVSVRHLCTCGTWSGDSPLTWQEHVAWAIIEADPFSS